MPLSRRTFIQGCCAGIAAMSGARLGNLVFAGPNPAPGRDIIINVFLRGGYDALNFLIPHGDANYHTARPTVGLKSNQVLDLDGYFGLHPATAPLKELLDQGHLAIIAAAGSPDPSRSHFESQDYMDRGVPGQRFYSGGGWLTRYLNGFPSDEIFKAISQGSSVAASLSGYAGALSVSDASGFTLSGSGSQLDDLRRSLRHMYGTNTEMGNVVSRMMDAADYVDYAAPGAYVPTPGITYPDSSVARSFASIAQLIKMDLGLQAATVDFGGWDTHETQVNFNSPNTGRFTDLIGQLSSAIQTFWNDMAAQRNRIVIVVMSEFGRRLRENGNRGTDHGHGGVMFVVSTHIVEGKIYGTWPGLSNEELFENVDLAVTTDYRTVLSEILNSRLGVLDPATIFPGFTVPPYLGFLPLGLTAPKSPSGLVLD